MKNGWFFCAAAASFLFISFCVSAHFQGFSKEINIFHKIRFFYINYYSQNGIFFMSNKKEEKQHLLFLTKRISCLPFACSEKNHDEDDIIHIRQPAMMMMMMMVMIIISAKLRLYAQPFWYWKMRKVTHKIENGSPPVQRCWILS